MAYREVPVIEIRENLPRWRLGESQRAIGRVVAADRKTGRRYIEAAGAAGLYESGGEVTDDDLARVVALAHLGAPVRVGSMRQHGRAHAELIEVQYAQDCGFLVAPARNPKPREPPILPLSTSREFGCFGPAAPRVEP